MIRALALLLVATAALAQGPGSPPNIVPAPPPPGAYEATATLQSVVDGAVARMQQAGELVGVAVGVVDHGKPQTFVYGEAEAGGRKVGPSTVFQIGSVTKTFTAALLALLARRGVVALDAPLAKYVPLGVKVPTFRGQPIRLVDLATHTSGLPRGVPHSTPQLSTEQMYTALAAVRLTRAPGEQYEYSNFGFALLAHALMRATGADYQTLVARELCDPLRMEDTRVQLAPAQIGRRAVGYGFPGFPARMELNTWPAFNGAGALRSTLADMLLWLQANMGLRATVLTPVLDTLQKRRHDAATPETGIGLAWQMQPLAPGSSLTVVHKNGGTAGFFAFVAFVRDTKTGVVLLSNTRARKGRYALDILRFLNRDALTTDGTPPVEPEGDLDDPEAY